jgi:hypothetical protein
MGFTPQGCCTGWQVKKKVKVSEAMMKPRGARGIAQVKRLGRTYKTGGFAKIAAKASKKYGSAEAGKRVAGAIFQKMARAHARKG